MNRKLAIQSLATAAIGLVLAGCAAVEPRTDYDAAARQVEGAVGWPLRIRPGEQAIVQARVQELLAGGLRPDEAVQLCLLNNPRLAAELARVGVGRAEVVQAGLFTNPTLMVSLRFPDAGGIADFELNLAQNIAELWLIPPRRLAAERELERTILSVARLASVTALDARAAYFRAVKADRQTAIARENVALTQQLVDLTLARRTAGPGSTVDVNLAQSQNLEAELRARDAALAAVEARAALARLAGLTLPPLELPLAEPPAEPDAEQLTAEELIATAQAARLDLRAAEQSVQSAAARIELERARLLRVVEPGVSSERNEIDGKWVVGPTLGVEVPLFDQNQAQIARARFGWQQALDEQDALRRELVQEAYVAIARLQTALGNLRFYQESLLPLLEQSLELTRQTYIVGQTSFLSVLDAQRLLLNGRAEFVAVLDSAWQARVELERVAGRPLAVLLAPPTSVPASGPAAARAHPVEDSP